MRILLLFGMGLILFVSCSSVAPITNTDDLTARFQKIYKKSLFPGFSLTIVKRDNIAYQQSFGLANVAGQTAYTNQTTQPIGSVSKLMIGLALMKAVEKGLLTLDTDINTVLPFRVINPNAPGTPILVKHLVTHTSGILDRSAAYLSLFSILPGESLTTSEARRMQTELKAATDGKIQPLGQLLGSYLLPGGVLYSADNFGKTAPGITYAYSNLVSSLAAYMVELVTKQPVAEFTKAEIFEPLGMKNTAWFGNDLPASQRAILYWTKEKPLPR